ncbi:radical SAM protein [Candidatus Woesearchaeota archaeon]|nr:radical SAM protein [Candidatus Woesearchaeota archaeon]
MIKIEKTPYYSYCIGSLPKGCELCVQGLKSVFFITGLCSKTCFFCPISDHKRFKDVVYVNERPTFEDKEIIKEIKLCSSKGVGITGGDPLLRTARLEHYIELFKKTFGTRFHLHMYIPLNHVLKVNMKSLYKLGLDEIRFHPDLDLKYEWERILQAKKYDWDIGIEIPVVPKKEKEIKELIDYVSDKADFINLNELELSDTNFNKILAEGYRAKNEISYGVKGSEELALKLMEYIIEKKYKLSAHYCTTTLKDRIQLAGRLKRRAKNVKKAYDIMTEEGLLIRGAIYLKELEPGFAYRKKLAELTDKQKKELAEKLEKLKERLRNSHKIPAKFIGIDHVKYRILLDTIILQEIKDEIDYKCAIVTEFPTYDMFEVQVDFL